MSCSLSTFAFLTLFGRLALHHPIKQREEAFFLRRSLFGFATQRRWSRPVSWLRLRHLLPMITTVTTEATQQVEVWLLCYPAWSVIRTNCFSRFKIKTLTYNKLFWSSGVFSPLSSSLTCFSSREQPPSAKMPAMKNVFKGNEESEEYSHWWNDRDADAV